MGKWINVKDKLPEENKMVLVYTDWDCDCYVFASYSDGNWYLDGGFEKYGQYNLVNGITHWKYLPEKPI